jgi:hypothetical protein
VPEDALRDLSQVLANMQLAYASAVSDEAEADSGKGPAVLRGLPDSVCPSGRLLDADLRINEREASAIGIIDERLPRSRPRRKRSVHG